MQKIGRTDLAHLHCTISLHNPAAIGGCDNGQRLRTVDVVLVQPAEK